MAVRRITASHYRFGNLIGLWALIDREIMRFVSVYMQAIIAPVITAILYYIVFALAFDGVSKQVGEVSFLQFLAPGLIMMTMVQNAFVNSSSSLVISKIQGSIVDVFMPPLSPFEIFLGYSLGALARGLAVGLCAWLAMMWFVPLSIDHIGVVLIYAVLGNMMLGSLGVMAGIWADKFDHIATVSNFVVTPLAFLSGTFYSMRALPEMWQFMALFNPFYYMIDGFRAGFIGMGDTSFAVGVSLLLVINVLLGYLIMLMLRTGYKIKA